MGPLPQLVLYIFFGVLPSTIWLGYYLNKDLHPEPKRMILNVFLFGILVTVPVFFIQLGLLESLRNLHTLSPFIYYPVGFDIVKWFVIIAFTEEMFKYLVVKMAVLKSAELDEPLDIMLYMVISALGFAALENMLYLFSPINNAISFGVIVKTTITVSFIRFIGATFLHTLCSAFLGYFLALSFFQSHRKLPLTIFGILGAVSLHGLYNFSIMTLQRPLNYVIPIVIIFSLAIFMIYAFDKIKKIKDICDV
ncbi:MAG: hypothetical protein UR46_C0034G0002 [Parcubacteria group bacterium GW2011_GWA1_33_6]|uniref:Protease PrsW n=1 Tax=Candidatus Staskawiczbacteria bacterium RIFCSPHIGHO2_02_FULL_33_16 TaxID=1802204 RepID=A0A1G2HXF8_9BACT|nr:MAG: hypothetical protein UR31_C0028G0003 [Parcubacteria group bacterium GW2011_GWA2_33_14]KKP53434.1 MAG: hypothetical protein UR46_C0034G0002 [Parcubacteria group bacterium GW2011_GWA1_33_6]OGZ67234.1 MAG: hypothetical protein A3D34_00410 [Candidatus Staskawiczbacteria bacterium RIFCSPHIGHO2_02_FULL_33_16]OGZ70919.1 MAG: hypothetical protein A2980_02780 [Candidatus Staskawiczbacteria bacterium RIFCSPLOWO2_01_FULL_33_13]